MLGWFEEELPNLLRVLDLAEGNVADPELGSMATGICSGLMRYFFVIQLGHVGSQVMLRGARLALRDGRMRSASDLLTQMVALACRSQERVDIVPAMAMVDEIGLKSHDSQTLGNLALCRAIAASPRQQNDDARAHALVAIARFEEALAAAAQLSEKSVDLAEIENDLSSAYSLLGGALLEQRECAAAADAYRRSLDLARGQSVAVNAGQLHHQIGNCEAYLGNLAEAAIRYLNAADQFRAVGMRGYLANALGEFGNLLLEFGPEGEGPAMPSIGAVEAGVDDLADAIVASFGQYPFDLGACSAVLRNLFGMVVVISLANKAAAPSLPTTLRSELLPWAEQAVYDMDNIWWDELGGDAVRELRALLDLEAALAQFERDAHLGKSGPVDLCDLAAACRHLGYWGGHRQKGADWLVVYAARRWGVAGAALNNLAARLPVWNPGEPLLMVSRQPSA
jgi:tetratricopeptide (TPR) repeat protein